MSFQHIQVIDGASNSTYDIYEVPQWLFDLIFPDRCDIAFLDEVETRLQNTILPDGISEVDVWSLLYKIKVDKKNIQGIHGTLHLTGSLANKKYYPGCREAEVIKDRLLR